jgi:UDP:flavonoid glycosyltransferase YjiC (YdhE family)
MSKILISTLPVSGHIKPALAVATKLKAVGHEVVFAFPEGGTAFVSSNFKCIVTTNNKFYYKPTTLRFWPWYCAHDIKKIENNIRYVLGDWTLTQFYRLREIAQECYPDLIISDCFHVAPLIIARERDIPSAALGVTPYRNLISGSAPLRSGIAPATNRQQAIIYDFINRAIQRRFYHVRNHLTENFLQVSPTIEDAINRAPLSMFGICQDLSTAYLQCSSPCLEDRPTILEANGVEFIGPMNEGHLSPERYEHESALNKVTTERKTKATVFITWGTVQPTPPPEFMALAKELGGSVNLNVIVAPPNNHRIQISKQLIAECSASQVTVTSDFKDFLPKLKTANVFVSNGGFGGVKAALTLGIPVVCFGNQDDKPDVCGRVQRSKAGIGFSLCINQRRIIHAIRRVLREPSFTIRAQTVGKELSEYDKSLRLERIVERLLDKKVNRSSTYFSQEL